MSGEQMLTRIGAVVAQSVERRIGSAEVTGSIPVSSLSKKNGNVVMQHFRFCFFCESTAFH